MKSAESFVVYDDIGGVLTIDAGVTSETNLGDYRIRMQLIDAYGYFS